jgi:hypothetical protein
MLAMAGAGPMNPEPSITGVCHQWLGMGEREPRVESEDLTWLPSVEKSPLRTSARPYGTLLHDNRNNRIDSRRWQHRHPGDPGERLA